MPTRIHSTGMGIALLLNSGVSTLIAALFLPVVGNYGLEEQLKSMKDIRIVSENPFRFRWGKQPADPTAMGLFRV
jgi:hypothetical protein